METPNFAIGNISLGDGVLYAILGMLVVFFALVLLMVIIKILVALTDKKPAAVAEAPAPAEAVAPVKRDDPAPGSAGEIKLYTTDPKDAAMIMAIVADSLGKPLNELRFKSIREIKG